ncbi:hypothetical protein [Kosmotoga pacifica]|uniref:SLH domain-containing protein n=1 Tax=Kosmotoga pacifica TaxID=1330330 RepID=A0A0G2ZB09_9BACT|nr:hypothetical protein [Kosmotoga pacifica]AKI96774.1 hypothetical protein IX53_01885 [Kosmotoga pacifica]
MKRRTMGLLVGLLLLLSIQLLAVVEYEDVAPGHWAYGDIVNLTELGILSGIKVDGKLYYKGSDPLNRYQAAVLLGKLLKYIDENYQKIGVSTAGIVPEDIMGTLNRLEMAIKDESGNIIQLSEILEIVKELEAKVATLESKRIEESVPLPQSAIQDILKRIKAVSEDMSYLRLDINTLASSSTEYEKVLNDVTTKLELIDSGILGLKERLGSLEALTKGHDASFKTLGESIRLAKKELDSLSDEVNTLKSKLSSLEVLENDLSSNLENFRADILGELDGLKTRLGSLEAEFEKFATRDYVDNELEKTSTSLKAYIDNKFEGLATKEELTEIKVNLSDLITRSDLSSALKLYVGIDELTKAKEEFSKKTDELESGLNEVRNFANERYDELAKMINVMSNRLDDVENLKNDVSGLQINYSKVSADLLNLKSSFDALKASYDDYSASSLERLDALEGKIGTFDEAFSALEKKINDKLGEDFVYFENLMVDVTKLQDKVGAIEVAFADVKNTVQQDHVTLTKMASETEILTAKVSDIETKFNDFKLQVPTQESVRHANDNAVTALYVGIVGVILGIAAVVLTFFPSN